MSAFTGLWGSAGLLLVALVGLALGDSRQGTPIVYSASLILCFLTLIAALAALLGELQTRRLRCRSVSLGLGRISALTRLRRSSSLSSI
jgi:hypothetical protein